MRTRIAPALCALVLILPVGQVPVPAANAACTAPIGNAGQIVHNTDYHVPQYCNGTQWEAFSALDPLAGDGGCLAPAASEGRLLYNGDYHVLQYCNDTAWVQVGGRGVNGSCIAPAGVEGQLVYNSDYHVLQYCNGATWVQVGGGCTPSADPATWTARPEELLSAHTAETIDEIRE